MRATRHIPLVLVTTIVVLAVGPGNGSALAQESRPTGVGPDSSLAPADFGVEDENITILGEGDFFPCGTAGFAGDLCAGLNSLPNGARITQIAFYIDDDDPDFNFGGYLNSTYVDSAGDTPWVYTVLASVISSGAPGETVVYEFVDVPILYRQDVDGDGDSEVVAYSLRVIIAPAGGINFLMARVRWKRQVSPAPQAATFNDVPVNDPAFQFVEALVASGITAGCGAGNFCPDAPLTRRQMAVFLAKALGLHWPWDAQ